MPYIKVDTKKLNNYSSEIASCEARVKKIRSGFVSCINTLDWDVKNASNIVSRSNSISADLRAEASSLDKMERFLAQARAAYRDLDGEKMQSGYDMPTNFVDDDVLVLTEEEIKPVIEYIRENTDIPENELIDSIREGVDIGEKVIKGAKWGTAILAKVTKFAAGASKVKMVLKDGEIIISNFKRSGWLNKVTTFLHGKGVAMHYTPSTLAKTPGIGTVFKTGNLASKVAKFAETADKVATAINVGLTAIDGAVKIGKILGDDTKSTKQKVCDVTAVGYTTVASAALDVAAPIVGKACLAIPVPGLNVVAAVAAEFVVGCAADAMRSEAVVQQVSSSVGKLIDCGAAIGEAGKAVLESKSVGDAIKNTAELVGEVAKTVITAKVEAVKVATTVVVETAKVAVDKVVSAAKTVANVAKKIFKGW